MHKPSSSPFLWHAYCGTFSANLRVTCHYFWQPRVWPTHIRVLKLVTMARKGAIIQPGQLNWPDILNDLIDSVRFLMYANRPKILTLRFIFKPQLIGWHWSRSAMHGSSLNNFGTAAHQSIPHYATLGRATGGTMSTNCLMFTPVTVTLYNPFP